MELLTKNGLKGDTRKNIICHMNKYFVIKWDQIWRKLDGTSKFWVFSHKARKWGHFPYEKKISIFIELLIYVFTYTFFIS